VDAKTENSAIEAAFDRFTSERKDIAILLINQHVCCCTGLGWELAKEAADKLADRRED
jgi:hypothetical protein